jgi:hypothetical protein
VGTSLDEVPRWSRRPAVRAVPATTPGPAVRAVLATTPGPAVLAATPGKAVLAVPATTPGPPEPSTPHRPPAQRTRRASVAAVRPR